MSLFADTRETTSKIDDGAAVDKNNFRINSTVTPNVGGIRAATIRLNAAESMAAVDCSQYAFSFPNLRLPTPSKIWRVMRLHPQRKQGAEQIHCVIALWT